MMTRQAPLGDPARWIVRTLDGREAHAYAADLGEVLADCVAGGASVSFMHPFSAADGAAFYKTVAEDVAAGRAILVAGFDGARAVGTVQVRLAMPPNQPHRAEIAKMLVHRGARRRGLGAALLRTAEAEARKAGRTLLCLDTASIEAERVYRACGWIACGFIPGFALLPDGRPCGTRLFYKRLDGEGP